MQEKEHRDSARVWFPVWTEALGRAPLGQAERAAHRNWIIRYLKHCKDYDVKVCRLSGRAFARQTVLLSPAAGEACKAALAWFFTSADDPALNTQKSARGGAAPLPSALCSDVPPPGQADLGATAWERRLIERIRLRHLLWRTEQTYRAWAWKFAAFLRETPVEKATGDDLRHYLTELAVRQRVSAATQSQALNALVFLLEEALQKDLGDFSDFARGRRLARLPVVLTREECQQLFDQLAGATRLMAELMFGSGLRLLELLRLRVKDVDLVRCTVTVRGGKGDKDRMTVLPESLVEPLRAPNSINASRPIPSGTLSPPIWWNTARISGLCRTCWAMPTSPRRKSTFT